MLPIFCRYLCAQPALTAQEIRGREIYREGKTAAGKPVVAILSGGTEVSAMACANCHGHDGRGRSEAGVTPPNIRWEDLTRPYEVSSDTGRRHGPYSERLLIRAVALGFDAAGGKLSDAMPRFVLQRSEADDLIAYLKKLGADRDPGLSDQTIRIGVTETDPVRAALAAYFTDVNNSGGLYGRRIELVFRDLTRRPGETAAALDRFLKEEPVFALLDTFIAGAEKETAALLNQEKVPLIGAQTLLPGGSPYMFFADSGVAGQADALADFARNKYAGSAVVVSGAGELAQTAAGAVRARWADIRQTPIPAEGLHADVAFLFLPEEEMLATLRLAGQNRSRTAFLIPAAFATGAVLERLRTMENPGFLATSFLSSDITPGAASIYARLSATYKLPTDRLPAQFTALCQAAILVEGLKRAGRDLSRTDLKESIEGLYEFPCGFGQPVTFTSGRHTGVEHFHIIPVR